MQNNVIIYCMEIPASWLVKLDIIFLTRYIWCVTGPNLRTGFTMGVSAKVASAMFYFLISPTVLVQDMCSVFIS